MQINLFAYPKQSHDQWLQLTFMKLPTHYSTNMEQENNTMTFSAINPAAQKEKLTGLIFFYMLEEFLYNLSGHLKFGLVT